MGVAYLSRINFTHLNYLAFGFVQIWFYDSFGKPYLVLDCNRIKLRLPLCLDSTGVILFGLLVSNCYGI